MGRDYEWRACGRKLRHPDYLSALCHAAQLPDTIGLVIYPCPCGGLHLGRQWRSLQSKGAPAPAPAVNPDRLKKRMQLTRRKMRKTRLKLKEARDGHEKHRLAMRIGCLRAKLRKLQAEFERRKQGVGRDKGRPGAGQKGSAEAGQTGEKGSGQMTLYPPQPK
jgi:hypothetical protein